jgi:hypothetical protein
MSQFEIVDISDYYSLRSVAVMPTAFAAYGVALAGSFAYVADYVSGLLIIDVTDPTLPTLTATLDTPGFALDVSIDGHFAYVVGSQALAVIDVTVAEDPRLIGIADAYGVKGHQLLRP